MGREVGGVAGAGSDWRSESRPRYTVGTDAATAIAATAMLATLVRRTRRRAVSRNASNGGGTIWSPRRRSRSSSDMVHLLQVVLGVVQQAGEAVSRPGQPRLHRALRDPELRGDVGDG